VLLPRLEAVPSFDDWVVDLLVEIEGLDAVVDDADADVWEHYAAPDCVVKCEALAGLLVREFVLHLRGQEVFDEVLVVFHLWRESPWDLTVLALRVLRIYFLSHSKRRY